MAETHSPITSIQGIDLSNYVRDKNSYNPIVYIHKKFVPSYANKHEKMNGNVNEVIKEVKTSDKSLQCDPIRHETQYRTKIINRDSNPLVEQTIKFAKDLIPLTIPPSTDTLTNPVYYTIKTKKSQKHKKSGDNFEHEKDVTYEKEKSKRGRKAFTEDKVKILHSFSARDSMSRSSQNNTLDDINENRSLCCSLSEYSEKKNLKRDRFCNKNKQSDINFIPSDSFEALAEQFSNANETKLKIHLMNDKDKGLLCESIKTPVIKAIQECIQELHKANDTQYELEHIQTNVRNNSQKLDYILDKLTAIERRFEMLNDKVKNKEKMKVSKLEELEQDVITRETSSEEEIAQIHFAKRKKSKNVIVTLSPKQEEDETEEDGSVEVMDRGEGLTEAPQRTQTGMRTEKTGRIPARFCWTDSTK